MESTEDLKKFLKGRRLAARLPQTEVSRALGYKNSQFISNWERGLSMPPMKALPVLGRLYNVPPELIYQKMEKAAIGDLVTSLRKEFEASRRS